jgi:hypothetical protein
VSVFKSRRFGKRTGGNERVVETARIDHKKGWAGTFRGCQGNNSQITENEPQVEHPGAGRVYQKATKSNFLINRFKGSDKKDDKV